MPEPPWSVLVVERHLRSGGVQRAATMLLRRLSREHFRPSLAVFDASGPLADYFPPGVPVHNLGERTRNSFLGPAARLRRLIRATQPAVILAMGRHANLRVLATSLLFASSVPVVISVQTAVAAGLRTSRAPRLLRLLRVPP
jgi:Glycosyltransferase Family 4